MSPATPQPTNRARIEVHLATRLVNQLNDALDAAEVAAVPDDLSAHAPARGGLILPRGATKVSE